MISFPAELAVMLERFKRSDDRPILVLGTLGATLFFVGAAGPSFLPTRLAIGVGSLAWAVMMILIALHGLAVGRVQFGDRRTGFRYFRETEPRRFGLAIAGHLLVSLVLLAMSVLALSGGGPLGIP